jgi:DNA polymerase-3 subunit beta
MIMAQSQVLEKRVEQGQYVPANIHVQRRDLAQALHAEKKSSWPILRCVHCLAYGGKLRIRGYNLEFGVEQWIEADSDRHAEWTMPAHLIHEIVNLTKSDRITLVIQENAVEIHDGNYKCRAMGFDPAEFPKWPELEKSVEISFSAGELQSALSRVAFAASNDDSRMMLTGVLFESDGEALSVVATDTHRLSKIQLSHPGVAGTRMLISAGHIDRLLRLVPGEAEIVLRLDKSRAEMRFGDTAVYARTLEVEHYPNYHRVIPTEHKTEAIIPTDILVRALRRLRVISRENVNRVLLNVAADNLRISCHYQAESESEETIEIKQTGDDVEISFNSVYLLDYLRRVGSPRVRLRLNGSLGAGAIIPDFDGEMTAPGAIYVLMPMQIA